MFKLVSRQMALTAQCYGNVKVVALFGTYVLIKF